MNIQGIHPAITSPLLGQSASAVKPAATANTSSTTGTSGSSSTGSNSTSATSLQQTFLNLLVTELQNQDPTAPVDPTEMVGQLVSLNQLDQLISINSTLGSLVSGGSTTAANAASQGPAQLPFNPTVTISGAGGTATDPTSAAAAALHQAQTANARTASMNSLMNLYGNMGAPALNPTY
jgi:flagellar basal-body rod modification protein FlgD